MNIPNWIKNRKPGPFSVGQKVLVKKQPMVVVGMQYSPKGKLMALMVVNIFGTLGLARPKNAKPIKQ